MAYPFLLPALALAAATAPFPLPPAFELAAAPFPLPPAFECAALLPPALELELPLATAATTCPLPRAAVGGVLPTDNEVDSFEFPAMDDVAACGEATAVATEETPA